MKTNPDKNIFRQKGISARENLSPAQVKDKSEKITRFLMTLPEIKNSSEVFCYLSSQKKNEVGTDQFIRWTLERKKNIYVPRSNWKEKTLTLHKLPALPPDKAFFEEKFGILEPKENYNLLEDLSKLEIVILPGTAGDLKGTRYGLKAGFYDRFLEKLFQIHKGIPINHRDAPTTILILFEEQMLPELPREEHDFPVKVIVTDKKIYRI